MDTMDDSRGGEPPTEPLLGNVFNYDVPMKTEFLHPPKDINSIHQLIDDYYSQKSKPNQEEEMINNNFSDGGLMQHEACMSNQISQGVRRSKQFVSPGISTEPLLSHVFNFETGFMTEHIHPPQKSTPHLQTQQKSKLNPSKGKAKTISLTPITPDDKPSNINPPQKTTPHLQTQQKCKLNPSKGKAKTTPLTPITPDDQLVKENMHTPFSPLSTSTLFNVNTSRYSNKVFSKGNNKGIYKENVSTPNAKINPTLLPCSNQSKKDGHKRKSSNEKTLAHDIFQIRSAHQNVTKKFRNLPNPTSASTMPPPCTPCFNGDNISTQNYTNDQRNKGKKAMHLPQTMSKGKQKQVVKNQNPYNDYPEFGTDESDVNSLDGYGDDMNYESYELQRDEENRLRKKGKQPIGNPLRKLDFDENKQEGYTSDYDHDIEYSYIADMLSDQSNGESEEDLDNDDQNDSDEMLTKATTGVKEYATLGAPTVKCSHCQAWMWKEERVNKTVTRGAPIFSLCCAKGQIKLPKEKPTPSYMWQLHNDKQKSQRFKDGIRLYNSLFAFTSTGGKIDHSINNGGAPYIYRLNGQNHHLFGSLLPEDGEDPKFCQLYIYDTENELHNRLKWVNVADGDKVDAEIVEELTKMLDETNELVQEFRSARDRFEREGGINLEIKLKVSRSESGRENHVDPSDEIAGIMVGDMDDKDGSRDIIIESYMKGLERISDIHPKLMALQYPLLFPWGCDGFHKNIPFGKGDKKSEKKRDMISMKEYYSYKFQVRTNEGMTPRLGGRLYQQYVVDAFSTIEQARLWWLRRNQTMLRMELYTNIKQSLTQGTSETSNMEKGFILPAGFVGSRRYMQQNFQDALAVCQHIGHPDIFLTMTTNPVWDEVIQMMKLIPHCSAQNSPDIMARVFRLKLDQLIDDIMKKHYFGTCLEVMYVVEFQKRGLPYVHMLIWLDSASKQNLIANVDKFVSSEISDPKLDPVGYAAVKAFMMHGPCGKEFPKSPCMKQYKCTRHFPKKYCPATTFDQSGFPIYKRRQTNVTIKKGKADLGNQWVVPYNRDLLVKYQCHINVEICAHARSLKYLFKYCLKGHDRATVEIRGKKRRANNGKKLDECEDEIQSYFDGRYICGCEAAYRIFGFTLHHRSLAVERLSFLLDGKKHCTFRSNEPLPKVAAREKEKYTQLEAYFILNSTDSNATKYLYDEIPQYYVWNDADRIWTVRKRGKKIGIYTSQFWRIMVFTTTPDKGARTYII